MKYGRQVRVEPVLFVEVCEGGRQSGLGEGAHAAHGLVLLLVKVGERGETGHDDG